MSPKHLPPRHPRPVLRASVRAPVRVRVTAPSCGHCGAAASPAGFTIDVGPHRDPVAIKLRMASASGGPGPDAPEGRTARQQLGHISRRIKAEMGNVARRGTQYGMMAGTLLGAGAAIAGAVVGVYFALPGLVVALAAPTLLAACLLLGAVAEVTARRLRKGRLDVADVVALERTYLQLQAKKEALGKLDGDDTAAWHKVNRMLEELSGGFFRAVRVLLCAHLKLKMRCGRYTVGSVFPETAPMLAADQGAHRSAPAHAPTSSEK